MKAQTRDKEAEIARLEREEKAEETRRSQEGKQETEAVRLEMAQLKARIAELELAVNPTRKAEKHYQNILQRLLPGAKHRQIREVGETDLTTEDANIEIKNFTRFHEVPGQLAKYHMFLPRPRKCAYYFGKVPTKDRLKIIHDLMAESGIEMYIFDENDVPYLYTLTRTLEQKWMDVLTEFVGMYVIKDPSAAMRATDICTSVITWATQNNRDFPENKKVVNAMLDSKFGKRKQVRGQSNHPGGVMGWKGFLLKDPKE